MCRWYINKIIDFLDIIHQIARAGSLLRRYGLALSIKPNWAGIYPRTETKSSLRNIVFK
jgi:hypothetical protein